MSGEMMERVARALWVNRYGMGQVFDRFCKDRKGDTGESQMMLDLAFADADAAIRAMHGKCYECGEPIMLACLKCNAAI